jgi:hypothetical protein
VRIRLAIPDRLVTPAALEAALEATMLANQEAVARGEVPHAVDAIRNGVKWKPEPFLDGEHFDLAQPVITRGWGDCDDLAPYLAGSMRAADEDAGARPRVYKTGPDRWHVVVETSDGQILDPSKWAGMGKRGEVSGAGCANGICGRIARPFARPENGAIAVMAGGDGHYWARCDVPMPDSDVHLASHGRSRHVDAAIDRAVDGAVSCGRAIGADVDRLITAGSILLGDEESLSETVGVVPALAMLAPAGMSLAKSLFSKGHGLSEIRAKAFDELAKKKGIPRELLPFHHAPGGGVTVPLESPQGGGPGSQTMALSYWPAGSHGPVVMRF